MRARSLLVMGVLAVLVPGCAWIRAASVDPTGKATGTAASRAPDVSADGRDVVFESDAPNLVAGDTNGVTDVFRRDAQTGTTVRISVSSSGAQGDGASRAPSISDDGSVVAFESDATNLVAGDGNGVTDVFVRTTAGTTRLVSKRSTGAFPNGASRNAELCGNGLAVVYETLASDLVAGDTNARGDVIESVIPNDLSVSNTRVSVGDDESQGNGASRNPSCSTDGQVVAFETDATNFTPAVPFSGDTNAASDVFSRNLAAGTTSLRSSGGTVAMPVVANGSSRKPSVAANGVAVAFESDATNIAAVDGNAATDVFVSTGLPAVPLLVSARSGSSLPGNGASSQPSVAADGGSVAFESMATNLAGSDTNGGSDIYLSRSTAGTWSTRFRASVTQFLDQATGSSTQAAITPDGRYVAYTSTAADLVDDTGVTDANGVRDVHLSNLDRPTVTSMSPSTLLRGQSVAGTLTGTGFRPGMVIGTGLTGFSVVATYVSPTQLDLALTTTTDAQIGAANLLVLVPGGGPGTSTYAGASCTTCVAVVPHPPDAPNVTATGLKTVGFWEISSAHPLTLSWSPPPSEAPVTGYVVEESALDFFSCLDPFVTASTLPVTAGSVTYTTRPQSSGCLRVRAVNAGGVGPPSAAFLYLVG